MLKGEVTVSGAKNSSLPILAASLLCGGTSYIHNCPRLSDVNATVNILNHLGCRAAQKDYTVTVESGENCNCEIPDVLMREMRSSIIFLGAILAKCKKARLSLPGGCELGPRPIDLHLYALRQMGAVINERHGIIDCRAEDGLKGANISLSFPSVGATENIMIAAATADGVTKIFNAAREPEICDLGAYLNSAGAKIKGCGNGTITIEGVESLNGCEHRVIPDRIEAATFMAAAAVTKGEVYINDVICEHLIPVISVFEQLGCNIKTENRGLYIKCDGSLKAVKCIRTMPHPGFPTDAQAIVMAVSTVAEGTSVFIENIFDNRFKHAGELRRLGADIKAEGKVAIVEGVKSLNGAAVKATDLRGGAALAVAGLCASGVTKITGLHHLDRGYCRFAEKLKALGADIERSV